MKLEIKYLAESDNYTIDSSGNIFSKPREGTKGGLLKQWADKKGYYRVSIWVDGVLLQRLVHRLVAGAFLNNPNKYPVVNHKNGVKTDNRSENLEWCTVAHNTKHAFDTGLITPSQTGKTGYRSARGVEVSQYDKSGVIINKYGSLRQASLMTSVNVGSISQCINNKLKTAGGFLWKRTN